MGDRTDIDALLIGALYGELTPADEARLTAHLESHPADRTALADLMRTREAVRSSRILSVQFEPPHSVSALLIQEAARRLPKPERDTAGWLHRFLRVLLVHPAISVAAMLVLVVGIAGTLHVKRGDQFAETASPSTASSPPPSVAPAPEAAATPVVTAAPVQEPSGAASTTNSGSAAPPGAREADAYGVDLAEASRKQGIAMDREQEAPAGASVTEVRDGNALGRAKLEVGALPFDSSVAADPKPAPKKSAGIVLRRPEPMPKDFDENKLAKRDGRYLADSEGQATSNKVVRAVEAGAAAGGAPTAVRPQNTSAPAAAPAETVTAKPSPAGAAPAGAADDSRDVAKAKVPPRRLSGSGLAQDAASPAPAPAARPAPPPPVRAEGPERRFADKPAAPVDGKAADEKLGEEKTLLGWARKQHDLVIAQVKSSNCVAAANLATEIYSRAPDYYAANVATDRSVKPCVAYLNSEREREDRSRAAAKRARASDVPASPTPAPSKK